MDERAQLEQAIAGLDAQRTQLGEAVVAPALAALRRQLARLPALPVAGASLARLEDAGLIRRAVAQPDLEYLFRHALVQDAAYGTLLRGDRVRLHQVVAEVLEQQHAGRLDEIAAVVGSHFLAAGDDGRALHYLQRAGDRALAVYAGPEAEAHFRAALPLARDLDTQAALLTGLAGALATQSRFAAMIPLLREAAARYQELGDLAQVARAYQGLVQAAASGGDWPLAFALGQEGLALTASGGDSVARAALMQATARRALFNGRLAEARALAEQALLMARRLGSPYTLMLTLMTRGLLPDDPAAEARALMEEAAAVARAAGIVNPVLDNNLGTILLEIWGEAAPALACFERAVATAQQTRSVYGMFFSLANVASAWLFTGDLARVSAHLPELRALEAAVPQRGWTTPRLYGLEGLLDRYRGALPAAAARLETGLALARERGYTDLCAELATALGDLLLETGHLARARAVLEETLAIIDRAVGVNRVLPRCLLSTVAAAEGDLTGAAHLLAEARRVAGPAPLPLDAAPIALAAAALAAAQHDAAAVARWLEQAAAQQRALGRRWYLARTLSDLARWLTQTGDAARATACRQEAGQLFIATGAAHYAAALLAPEIS